MKHSILILGAGKIGKLVAGLLADSGSYQVISGDLVKPDFRLQTKTPITQVQIDINQNNDVAELVKKYDIATVVSCLPYHCSPKVAEYAAQFNLNFFDLTEDVEVTKRVMALAKNTHAIFAPQCGLAPGFISIVAQSVMSQFDEVRRVRMRVGALPLNVSNPLQYCLTWSTDGLINEYDNPCPVIQQGQKMMVPALDGLEEIKIDGLTYEAFHTSGGVGSLIDSYADKVGYMDYKTMRYPGHCEKMRFLMQGLKLNEDRDTLKRVLENAIPLTKRDVVMVYVSVQGIRNGKLMEENYAEKFYPAERFGERWAAIQMTTASSLCASIDLCVHEQKFQGPILKQEQIDLTQDFLPNRFGQYYQVGV